MNSYKGYRFPKEIIGHAVWCYYRLTASLRDVQVLMLQRGIEVSHETINQWIHVFGAMFTNALKKRKVTRGDKWHMDEQCIVMSGKRYWLWRAIDQDGYELDILVQSRRNTNAALRFFKKLLKNYEQVPRVIITDKLARVLSGC